MKDVELNVQAGFLLLIIAIFLDCFFSKAIKAVMLVTPWIRLSEEVLADGILRFVTDNGLLPPGVPVVSVQGWAARMSFGLRKVVQRFRKVFSESPTGAKSKIIADLKKELVEMGLKEQQEPGQLSAEDLAEIAPPKPKFDWDLLKQKIHALQLAKKAEKETPVENTASEQGQSQEGQNQKKRPVASAVRTHRLPPLVLAALEGAKVQAPQPFAIVAKEDESIQAEGAGEPKEVKEKKKKGKNAKKTKGEKKKNELLLAQKKSRTWAL